MSRTFAAFRCCYPLPTLATYWRLGDNLSRNRMEYNCDDIFIWIIQNSNPYFKIAISVDKTEVRKSVFQVQFSPTSVSLHARRNFNPVIAVCVSHLHSQLLLWFLVRFSLFKRCEWVSQLRMFMWVKMRSENSSSPPGSDSWNMQYCDWLSYLWKQALIYCTSRYKAIFARC